MSRSTAGCCSAARRCPSRASTRSRRAISSPSTASTRSATTCCGTSRSGTDGEFSAEGITARYNADLANNLGNLVSRVATVVGLQVRRHRARPRPATAGWPGWRPRWCAEAAEAWNAGQPHLALEATWRLIRETNAELEAAEPWKAEPGPAVDAVLGSALEALRIVVAAGRRRPCRRPPRRSGAGSGSTGSPAEQRLPEAAAWGGYPAGCPVEKGPPLFPRRKV